MERPDGAFLRLSRWNPASPAPPPDAATLLILPGRAEYVEKYAELAGDFTRRGLHVVAMDWRGQGGASRLLPDQSMGHVESFDIFLDDMAAALPRLLDGTAGPALALGHSMGGHILLRFVAERTHPFHGIIASAPMLGINTAPLPEGAARQLARLAVRMGHGQRYALGQLPFAADPPPAFAGNRLTSDPDRFARNHRFCLEDPALALGGASWGWLDAALASIRHYFDQDRLEQVDLPILLLSGRADRIVRTDRHDLAARRLPRCTLASFPEGRHELLMEADPIRNRVLAAIDDFLARILPA
ncbi:alpha/beta fold hydrolase [Niveispirillum fermenti]|uniref:alpha/beta fold hydrolase n=1 Tax=Niveispirillum fermenti TaxID=1233113 RepID=UPI003A8C1FED